jgi:hypothetical protein
MRDYSETLLRKFPTDASKGFFVKPNIPSGKLGKALSAFMRLNPSDVLAVHEYGNMFSGGVIAFSATQLHHSKGFIPLEDLQGAHARQEFVDVTVNQGGGSSTVAIKTDGPEAARLLVNVLDGIIFQPKADEIVEQVRDYAAEGFDPQQVNWLQLRDEILKTIDLLHQRFQDGKISLMEFEDKKMELLGRL